MIKTNKIKQEFAKKGFKIGKDATRDFIIFEKSRVLEDINRIIRKATISGRKVIRGEDIT